MLKVIPSRRLHGVIQERLRRFIVESELRPGDKLPTEQVLCSRLGASRSAVREALSSLEGIGIIEVKHGKGRFLRAFDVAPLTDGLAYSLTFDSASIQDLLEVRRVLELAFVGSVTEGMESEHLDSLRRIVAVMHRKAERGEVFVEEDMAFHKAMFGSLKNQVLKKILDVFWGLFENLRVRENLSLGDAQNTVAFHQQIVDAMAAKDVSRAREALDGHFRDVERRLASAMQITGEGVALQADFIS